MMIAQKKKVRVQTVRKLKIVWQDTQKWFYLIKRTGTSLSLNNKSPIKRNTKTCLCQVATENVLVKISNQIKCKITIIQWET